MHQNEAVQMDIFDMLGGDMLAEPVSEVKGKLYFFPHKPKKAVKKPIVTPKANHVLDGKTDKDEIKARKYEYSNLAMEMEAKAKGKGTFNSIFPNQQSVILQYLLVMMKEEGLITYGEMEKAIRFHEVVRTHMDRRNHKIGTCEYLASYVTDESFHKLGFNDKSIKKCISILTQIGYIKVVTVKGVQRYIYPMLYRLESSDYMPNVTFDEANNYLYPKKND